MEETPTWEAWPNRNEPHVPNDQDSDFYYRRFNEDSSRLFSTQSNFLELFRVLINTEGLNALYQEAQPMTMHC